MGDMGDMFEAYREMHKERVEKTPDRVQYAIQKFEENGIKYRLLDESIGHFHCWRKSDNKLFQFWAGTGKVMGNDNVRGIHGLVKMLLKENKPVEGVKKINGKAYSAIKKFEKNGINYKLLNESIGHFHCWRKCDNKLFQFWASTGKIMGYNEVNGIDSLIELLLMEVEPDWESET